MLANDGTSVRSGVRVAICGFGASAEYFHLPLILRSGCVLAAAFDSVPRQRDQAAAVGFAHVADPASLADDLRRLAVDLLVICSPNALHAQQAADALQSGVDVIVDKPVSGTEHEFTALCSLARRYRRMLVPFHNRQFDSDHEWVRGAIRDGVLGKVLRIDANIGQWGPFNRYAVKAFHPAWRTERHYGGGVFNDWGPHLLDQLLTLAGDQLPTQVNAVMRSGPWSSDCDDVCSAIYEWSEFFVRMLVSTMEMAPVERLRVCGTEATLIVAGDDESGTIEIVGRREKRLHQYHNSVEAAMPLYRVVLDADTSAEVRLQERARRTLLLMDATRRAAETSACVLMDSRGGPR